MDVSLKPRVTISLELTEEEAVVLCALAGGVGVYGKDHRIASTIKKLYYGLDGVLAGRTHSFSDFFEGKVSVK